MNKESRLHPGQVSAGLFMAAQTSEQQGAKEMIRRLPRPTKKHIELAKKLGVSVRGLSRGAAVAKIEETVGLLLYGAVDNRMATAKQIAFGKQIGLDLEGETLRMASARIAEVMDMLNCQAIRRMRLKPGDKVRPVYPTTLSDGRKVRDPQVFVVSSISPEGTVYFKGSSNQRAWARNLEKLNNGSA